MKLSSFTIATVLGILITSCHAQVKLLATIAELAAYCSTVGPNTYVAVRYENTSNIVTYDFNECYPYELPTGELAQVAVFCKTTTCTNNPNPDCSGGAVPPVPVPIPAGTVLPNVVDFVQLLGQGATCQRNGLSS
ncbi:hypothetical protein LZ554_001002 [Drepanopeziza brunnea f. sp. 'monogermtubi']|nr:hypothetical protein LZ554_001002 [Drepanopeziza brunnea f. sp. 'monogermtubi']